MGTTLKAQVDTTCTQVSFNMVGGQFPNEVSYNVVNSAGAVVASGTPASTPAGVWCLPADCYMIHMLDSFGDGWNGAMLTVSLANSQTYVFTLNQGMSGIDQFGVGVDSCGTSAVAGCMDPSAANYNPQATINVNCSYLGCTDAAATNYNAQATIDDGSCTYCNGVFNQREPVHLHVLEWKPSKFKHSRFTRKRGIHFANIG